MLNLERKLEFDLHAGCLCQLGHCGTMEPQEGLEPSPATDVLHEDEFEFQLVLTTGHYRPGRAATRW
jgi:hypothetical protein